MAIISTINSYHSTISYNIILTHFFKILVKLKYYLQDILLFKKK